MKKEDLEKIYNGSAKDLAEALNIGINKAYELIKEHGLRESFLNKETLIKLASECKDVNEISDKLGRSPSRVYHLFRRNSVKLPKVSRLNSTLPISKDELQKLYDKLTMAEIAEIFQVSRQTICNWVRNYGIKARKAGGRFKSYAIKYTKDEVLKVYLTEGSVELAAKSLGIKQPHFNFLLKHYGIAIKRGPLEKVKEDLLLEDYNVMSYKEMAKKYNVSLLSVYRKAKKLGLTKRKTFTFTKEYCEANYTRPYKEIAGELGCSSVTVSVAMREYNLTKKRKCNISDDDYKSYVEGVLSKKDLKEKYGYSIQTIREALRRIEK
jgi:transposase